MFSNRFCRRTREAAIASALFLAVGSAAAHGPGMGPQGGPGGPHGGAQVEQLIQQLKGKLALDTSQQVLFDNAVAATRAARQTGRAERERIHAQMKAELAKAEPDLAAMAALADAAQGQGQALRRSVRDQWLQLYATFTPAQKGIVRDALVQRMQRFEQFRERMHERFGGGQG